MLVYIENMHIHLYPNLRFFTFKNIIYLRFISNHLLLYCSKILKLVAIFSKNKIFGIVVVPLGMQL